MLFSRPDPGYRRAMRGSHRLFLCLLLPALAGCANALAEDRSAPCGATTYNTNLVEVEPAS